MDEEKRLKRQPVEVHNMGSFQQQQKLPDCNSFWAYWTAAETTSVVCLFCGQKTQGKTSHLAHLFFFSFGILFFFWKNLEWIRCKTVVYFSALFNKASLITEIHSRKFESEVTIPSAPKKKQMTVFLSIRTSRDYLFSSTWGFSGFVLKKKGKNEEGIHQSRSK